MNYLVMLEMIRSGRRRRASISPGLRIMVNASQSLSTPTGVKLNRGGSQWMAWQACENNVADS